MQLILDDDDVDCLCDILTMGKEVCLQLEANKKDPGTEGHLVEVKLLERINALQEVFHSLGLKEIEEWRR